MTMASKLEEWRAAGLITAETVAAIDAYEAEHRRPVALYVVGGLGALTITLGVLAIVASNWDAIPGGLKIALDLAIAAGLAAAIVAVQRRRIGWLRETLIALDYGFILASIGLISQVYHLGGATWQALALWSGLTALLVTRGEGRGLATAWIAGLQVTYGVGLVALADSPYGDDALALALVPAAPLLCLVISASATVRARRPRFAEALASIGWGELALLASVATLGFYESPFRGEHSGSILMGAALVGALAAVLIARAGALTLGAREAITPLRIYLAAAIALGYLPLLGEFKGAGLVGALIFLGEWALIAWIAHHSRQLRLLNLATAMIALRLLIIYFEVFGSLLDTGIGLISGGLLTVGLAYVWARKRKDFAAEAGAEGASR